MIAYHWQTAKEPTLEATCTLCQAPQAVRYIRCLTPHCVHQAIPGA